MPREALLLGVLVMVIIICVWRECKRCFKSKKTPNLDNRYITERRIEIPVAQPSIPVARTVPVPEDNNKSTKAQSP